jgi:hypothetical protein
MLCTFPEDEMMLIKAAKEGDSAKVLSLLNKEAYVNAIDKKVRTFLERALKPIHQLVDISTLQQLN